MQARFLFCWASYTCLQQGGGSIQEECPEVYAVRRQRTWCQETAVLSHPADSHSKERLKGFDSESARSSVTRLDSCHATVSRLCIKVSFKLHKSAEFNQVVGRLELTHVSKLKT